MWGRRIIYLLSLAGCGIFHFAYRGWVSWMALLTVAGLPWLSLALSLPGMLTLKIIPQIPDKVVLGTPVKVQLMGSTWFPIPVFRCCLMIRRATTGQTWKQKKARELPTDHCGALVMAPCRIRVFDYLGLFKLPRRLRAEKTLIVRPTPLRPDTVPDLERYLARRWRPKPGGGYSENHELRLYRPGDSLGLVHWKLTAKTGKLILREPMEPIRGQAVVTMDLSGSPQLLDGKFGRLLWMGGYLLERQVPFTLQVLTGQGPAVHHIDTPQALDRAVDALLCCPPVSSGSIRDRKITASWHYHLGGDGDES